MSIASVLVGLPVSSYKHMLPALFLFGLSNPLIHTPLMPEMGAAVTDMVHGRYAYLHLTMILMGSFYFRVAMRLLKVFIPWRHWLLTAYKSHVYAIVYALYNMAYSLGIFVGPLLAGVIMSCNSIDLNQRFQILMLIFSGVIIISSPMILINQRKRAYSKRK